MADESTLAGRVKGLIEDRRISMNKVGKRSGLSAGYISKLIKKEDPGSRPLTLEALAAALESTFDYVARGVGPREAPPAPSSWGFTRREVAMRILLARGRHAARDIEAASERSMIRDGHFPGGEEPMATLTLDSWVRELEREIASPTPQEQLEKAGSVGSDRYQEERAIVASVAEECGLTATAVRALLGVIAFAPENARTGIAGLYRLTLQRARSGSAELAPPFAAHPSVPAPDAGYLKAKKDEERPQLPAQPAAGPRTRGKKR